MCVRLLLWLNILIAIATVYSFSGDGLRIKRDSNATLELSVGKEKLIPEVLDESDEENEKEANKEPTTDVIPESDETKDHQKHEKKGKNIESGMPPKYPLKAESAETSAHDNEIGGCRDHPRAGLVCSKCENGNKCFPAEHESYTYSYCRRSCRHCDPSTSSFHTFWRIRAMSEFEPTWMLQQLEFYADPQEKISLVDDPEKAYGSSVYTGYKPSFAFDTNNETAWYPSGWGIHDNNDDWIAYEFTVAVRVHGIRMVVDKDHSTAQPKKVIVEASDKMYGPFTKKWTIYNTDYSVDKVYKLLECDVLWNRFEVDDGAWCFRLIAKLETWEGARRACEIEGGDLATVSNKEEQRFITDEVGLCSHTWFGLSHTNQGYYWNDGSNTTYRNWKEEMTYSDVQKQTLNCAAMDPEGVWYNFHCSNKFYFVCKKRLVPRADPRPDLTDNAWPYPPEVPPLIFFSPNVTVPVINSKNLEPGIFPDANGKVEGEEEEDITLSDLFYEQTVEHLKEKGLKPSEEIEADENQEETDFTQELNKIAINTSPGDFQNETRGDTSKNGTGTAHKQEQNLEEIPNKEANNAETSNASASAPKPKPKHKEKPVPPPPEDSDADEDSSYPEIVHGKPVEGGSNGKAGKNGKKIPKGQSNKNGTASPYFPEYQASMPTQDVQGNIHEQPHKSENILNSKNKKKAKHHAGAGKNKEIPMHPFTGPLGTSLSQQNISKSSRRKIKVLQPLESAAGGEELSIMSEANKIKRKKVLSRTLIHPKHEDIAAAKLARKHHVKRKHSHKKADVAPKVAAAAATPVTAAAAPAPVAAPAAPAATSASLASKLGKAATKIEPQAQTQQFTNSSTVNASPSLGVAESNEESGSGSAVQSEADTADIISDTDEEFWSK